LESSYSGEVVETSVLRILPGSAFWRQVWVLLKISTFRRFRAATLWLELALPLLFLLMATMFAERMTMWSDPIEHPSIDQVIPFEAVRLELPGGDPHYGMIPQNSYTESLFRNIDEARYLGAELSIMGTSRYFSSFSEFSEWVEDTRETEEHFYAIEWANSVESSRFTDAKLRISSYGLTADSLPDFFRATTVGLLHTYSDFLVTNISLVYAPLPSQPVLVDIMTNLEGSVETVLFCTVLFIPTILTAATYYGLEAETSLRDMFIANGASFRANRVRWWLDSFLFNFVLSIPFSISVHFLLEIDFWLLFVFYILATACIVSWTFGLVSLYPTQGMGRVVGLGTLMIFLVVYFWGLFTWLPTDGGYYEKRILSIFPTAAIPYTLAQMVWGSCLDFSQIGGPSKYPVCMGFVYMGVEAIVYYILFIIGDSCIRSKWFPASILWSSKKEKEDQEDSSRIEVKDLRRNFGEIRAVDGVNFNVECKEVLAVVGPNGSGKSSLLSMLAGCGHVSSGSIKFFGIDGCRDLSELHRMIGYCPQENILMDQLKANEWVETLCALRGFVNYDYRDIFETLGLNEQLRSRIGEMSGGNKRKVSLAAALICSPAVVILDEATSGVDFTSRTRIWSLISSLKNTTVIMATHTLEECEKIADRIMVMGDGHISNLATPNELRQIFKCGYLIETEEEHGSELGEIINRHGYSSEVEVRESRAFVVIPSSDDSHKLTNILKEFSFSYLLSIQNLEEKIFSHVQDHELEMLLRKEGPESLGECDV
jgi:ABC-type multidrug transport system ATPase subunit